jgi:hypothetical protein
MRVRRLVALLAAVILAAIVAGPAPAAMISVHYTEGVTHGFLLLRSPSGEVIADGDLLQVVRGDGVDSRLVFRFRDGSIYDETVVFSQQRVFTLLSYRLQQRGPSFPEEMEVSLERDREKGRYQVRLRRHGGDEENVSGDTELPPDVYNGMLIMVLRNLPKGAAETVHVLAFTPKPTLVQLEMRPIAEENVLVGARRVPATHFVLKPKLGLLKGAIAALLGKTPSDYHCWIITRPVPAFVNIDGPLYTGGPIWRFETVSPLGPPRPPDSAR